MYDLYIKYRDYEECGWWNNGCTTEFGIVEFIGLYILMESTVKNAEAWIAITDVLVTIFAQNLYVGGNNPAACKVGDACLNAALNFMASQIDGNSALLKGPESISNQNIPIDSPGLERVSGKDPTTLIHDLGVAALDPNSVILWDQNNGPSMWGNIKGAETIRNQLPRDSNQDIMFGTSTNTVYHMYGNAVYLSVYQYQHWLNLGVDMELAK